MSLIFVYSIFGMNYKYILRDSCFIESIVQGLLTYDSSDENAAKCNLLSW